MSVVRDQRVLVLEMQSRMASVLKIGLIAQQQKAIAIALALPQSLLNYQGLPIIVNPAQ